MNHKLAYAIAILLPGASFSSAAIAADSADNSMINEVVVTAQRRSENIQDVPISIQAMTSQSLQQLNITTFDDYIKYLPNVSSASNGPGQSEVFMRGLSAGSQASQGSSGTGLFPNVAIYLDNQSGQLPNRNLDIYAADLNRIEVLEGPQGTLFGSGAEAGVIRYITNEPKIDKTEGFVKAGYGVTAHGEPNSDIQAVLNLPLIAGKMAARMVVYSDNRGGYIDNVPATFTRKDSDLGIHYAQYATGCSAGVPTAGACPGGATPTAFGVPPGSPVLNNNAIAGRAINPASYKGMRAELLYKFTDDWDVLLSQSYQKLDTQGVFYSQPFASDGQPLNPLEVTLFNPSHNNDKFSMTSLTVNGKIGALKAVYTGGYLSRAVDQNGDYTNYTRGVYADYYQCYGPASGSSGTLVSKCFSPSAFWHADDRNTHVQHEFRLSTPDDWRLRGIVGAYWEDNKLFDINTWKYKSIPACTDAANVGCISNIGTIPGTTVRRPGVQSDDASFHQDQVRETKQTAFFASFDYDLIPKVLTLTVGTRHFKFDNTFKGTVGGSFGCFEQGAFPTGCRNYLPYQNQAFNLDAQNLKGSESGWKSRANITWHVTPDAMLYYTFSQGFRPGGFNQNGDSTHAPGPDGVNQFLIPRAYTSDKLANSEIGWKTEFLQHRLQWNGAIYREDWKNVQISFFNPGLVGNLFYNTNGQDFLIKGVETSLVARVFTGLTLQGAAAWNRSEQKNSPALVDNNPASVNFGKPITQLCNPTCSPVTNPFGPIGAPSADSPPLQFSLRARYDWTLGNGYEPFVQVAAQHTGHSYTQAGANPEIATGGAVATSRGRFENPAYSTYSASFGVAKDTLVITVFGDNLANSHASTFISTDQFIVAQTPLRPRVLGVSFSYSY